VTSNVKWTTSYVEDVCDNRATVIDPTHIKITWNTKAADPPASLIEASQSGRFGLRRPTPAKDVAPLQPGAPAAAALA
jgi:GDP-D-mannose dehydratase